MRGIESRLARIEARLGPVEKPVKDRSPWEWFSDSCPCGLPLGDCAVHPRAREAQRPPPGSWRIWGYIAGRGAGKTRAGACWIQHRVETKVMRLGCPIAPTAADIRDTLVEGPSGLLAIAPPWCRPRFLASKRRVQWPNGARAICLSGEEPERARGLNIDTLWADELACWQRAEATWNMAMLALRAGKDPRAMVTTTPRSVKILKRLMAEPTTRTTRGTTFENKHLAPEFVSEITSMFAGSRLAEQELKGEMIDISEAARFPMFDGNPGGRHVHTRAEYIPGLPVGVAIDCGLSRHVGALFFQARERDRHRRIISVFADYYAIDKTSDVNAQAIRAKAQEVCCGRIDRVYLDPASTAKSGVGPAARGEFARVLGERITECWPIHRVLEGLDQIEILLGGPDREPDLVIHPRCTFLIESFKTYKRKEQRGEILDMPEDPQHPAEEALDSLRGAVRVVYPEGRVDQRAFNYVPLQRIL